MDDLLLQKCITFMDKKEALRQKHFFSNPDENAVIAYIYLYHKQEINFDALSSCEWIVKKAFPFTSPYRQAHPRIYAAMMAVSQQDPDTVVARVMAFEQQFNRSFAKNNGLAVLAFIAAEIQPVEYQPIYYTALSIYNRMKDLHRFLTNDQDVIYAGILAMTPHLKEDVVDELVIMDDLLMNEYHLDGDYARRLSYVLALCEGTATVKVRRAMELIQAITNGWNRSINHLYFILPAVLANISISFERVLEDYEEVSAFLKMQKDYGKFYNHTRSLHTCMILLQYYAEDNLSIYAVINAIVFSITNAQRS